MKRIAFSETLAALMPMLAPTTAPAVVSVTQGGIDETVLEGILKLWKMGNGLCEAPGTVLPVDTPAGRYCIAPVVSVGDGAREVRNQLNCLLAGV